MKTRVIAALALIALTGAFAHNMFADAKQAFGFNSPFVAGFPGGRSVQITGGGAYDLVSNFVHSGGSFSCLSDINGGPLNGCKQGQGVRWDTAALLPSTNFQCTGSDPVKTANTGDHTVVLLADFYRQGDGDIESFTAKMIVSDTDLDPTRPGSRVWVQGVGCGASISNFN